MPNSYRRVPHPPFIDLPVSKPAASGYGYTRIPAGSRRIVGVMNHETQGRGSGPWYRDFFSCPGGQRCADALVDYLITRDGTIYRLNDPKNNRSPWANGGPLGLEGDGPAFYARFGASGVNNSLISIEFEKLDNEDFTTAQIQSGGLLNAYWHDQDDQDWETYPYVPRYGCVTSLAHFEIGTTNCGKGELDDISRVQAVARGEMKRWQAMATGPIAPLPPIVPSQPDIPALPGGLSVEEASRRFGTLIKHTPDGKTKPAPFDPRGVISLSWLHRCVETGEWPRPEDWWALTDSGRTLDIVTFSNDWQLIRTADRQGVMWARFADAQLEPVAA
ncbi:MAG: N-acetylmuramoyl-L-alanine amidase [Thermomicrobiales bacterium]|nr:N-acetylmuramoyl-L-alanine amidase [Thermomicrobiales bacterium]